MMIASSIEGRVRIRDDRLKDPLMGEIIRKTLTARPDIKDVSVNRKAGSLLISYHTPMSLGGLMDLLAPHMKEEKRAEGPGNPGDSPKIAVLRRVLPELNATRRRWVRRGMLGSLSISLLGAASDFKKLHVISGLGFVGILGIHLFDKRRLLFR